MEPTAPERDTALRKLSDADLAAELRRAIDAREWDRINACRLEECCRAFAGAKTVSVWAFGYGAGHAAGRASIGRTTSHAKAAAAKANGRKGGRPRKNS